MVIWSAKDGRGMDGGDDEWRQLGIAQPATFGHDPESRAEQRVGGGAAQDRDCLGLHRVEFGVEPRAAGDDLPSVRRLVDATFAAPLELEVLDDVSDVGFAAVDADLRQGPVELA